MSSHLEDTSLRFAMGHFATGVTIATTLEDGHDHAMTANSITSVSLEPPLVLVSVRNDSGWLDAVDSSGVWGISLLPESGRPAASWLSTGGRPLYGQLSQIPHHRGELGVALVDDSLATLECRTYAAHEAGDHTLVVGEVVASRADARRDDPLIYYRSRYTSTR
ncbi:flavin reductase family protein [Janibacter cremeus]|uniref:Flavin reductase (DIM6/NTAB) family NADH-FMN oxidoreductase RutF n=1 Tax=Janibacter cremeus TaxID=1285192 RepID=A0A852VS49_9MICO|nr:flavin reductase family protein [Janibacter cremeus]NYF97523.1 flavin reductase (DIM6/NTAB) family NADH-FMN oxidoreductase RutF [Janibacter cremeus]